jgi:hypothetical protein
MNLFDRIEDPRRRVLVRALAASVIAAVPAGRALGQLFGARPRQLPPDQSIFRLIGSATVNGTPATMATSIRPGDTIETGESSELVFVVGGHSMIVREQTRLVTEADRSAAASLLLTGLRLLTGKVLSVSRGTPTRVSTLTATIGIRGTGWYAEADPDMTYFCTCYGATEVESIDDPASRESLVSSHHDRPLYILREGPAGQRIRNAPVINHTDQELMLIEALVGRTPPFVFPREDYGGPRREY